MDSMWVVYRAAGAQLEGVGGETLPRVWQFVQLTFSLWLYLNLFLRQDDMFEKP